MFLYIHNGCLLWWNLCALRYFSTFYRQTCFRTNKEVIRYYLGQLSSKYTYMRKPSWGDTLIRKMESFHLCLKKRKNTLYIYILTALKDIRILISFEIVFRRYMFSFLISILVTSVYLREMENSHSYNLYLMIFLFIYYRLEWDWKFYYLPIYVCIYKYLSARFSMRNHPPVKRGCHVRNGGEIHSDHLRGNEFKFVYRLRYT